jgi:NAD(P)-dependent dehydrogenase (short-subunit alcohol dehydrogenase family)
VVAVNVAANTDRIVVITGAAGGMGTLFVERFLANGDTVIAIDNDEQALGQLAGKAGAQSKLHVFAGDVSNEGNCAEFAHFVLDKTGRVDVLINAAGFFPIQPFEEMTLGDWNKVVGTNLTGVFLMVRAMLPLMKDRGWGRIINIGSASMFDGVADQIHYVAAKAGVLGLSRSLSRVVGKQGITVNVVTPGLTVTPKVEATIPRKMRDAQIEARAIQREETAADLVGSVFFLASSDADFLSGQTINVDGGKHLL